MDDFAAELEFLIEHIDLLPANERAEARKMIEALTQRRDMENAQNKFLDFMSAVEPHMLQGPQHRHIGRLFERIANGTLKRVIINIAPRHSKSTMSSYLFPAWFLGKFPQKKIIMASHTGDLATDFGRKVRNLVDTPMFKKIFPDVQLAADSKAAGRWNTNHGGEYFALGVGAAMAGRGGDLVIIDDPHSEQEAKSGNPAIFDTAYEWYQSGPRQRLQPGGAIVVLMCMTGDTDVLMWDGTNKKLRDIRPGDEVATYEDGNITTSWINNWRSSGVDDIYTISTRSGRILRANERHPFLVDFQGVRKWARLRDLVPGMSLVATQAAIDQHEVKLSPDCATPAKHALRTTESILTRHTTHLDTMASGKTSCASVVSLSLQKACASIATAGRTLLKSLQNSAGQAASSTATASQPQNTKPWLQNAVICATAADSHQQVKTQEHIGTESSASTTATTQARLEACCATIATLLSDTAKLPKFSLSPPSTYAVTLDEIVDISPAGREEVFDVEVDRTENFIANGVVSHNTRWNVRDLTGRLIDNMVQSPDGDEWEVVTMPAILPSGRPLWEEFWSLDELLKVKATIDNRYWQAQYMQNPVAEEGALVKREWWRKWEKPEPPPCEFIIGAVDAAAEDKNSADYTSITLWGVFNIDDEKTGERVANIILLNSIRQRMEFPELKDKAFEVIKEWKPDAFIVEKKSNGTPLYQEMRRRGIPVSEFTPHRGTGNKTARLNAVADIVRSGLVWYPAGKRWAEQLVDEIASYPNYGHDDGVDTFTMAMMRFRNGGFIKLASDSDYPEDDEPTYKRSRRKYY